MTNKPNDLSFDDFKSIWQDITGVTSKDYKNQLISKLSEDLNALKNGIGASALTVFDIEKNCFLFVDNDIEKVTGIKRKNYFDKGVSYVLAKTKLSHIPLLISSTIKQKKFFKNKQSSFYNNFIVNREFAYKSEKKPLNWVLHQVVEHLFNESGRLYGVVVLQTQLKSTNYIGKFRFYIYDKTKNDIIYPEPSAKSNLQQLTHREREIVTLLLQNKSNKEIANALHISYHTVRTHRKSAMKKLNCHSIYELSTYCNTEFNWS